MKLFFSVLVCCLLLASPNKAWSKSYFSKYSVSSSGLKIGELLWSLRIDKKKYTTEVKLNSRGFLSGLFSFSGEYITKGFIKGGYFVPTNYSQKWETRKKRRDIEIYFEDNTVTKINQTPRETEGKRIGFEGLYGYYDPLTSILNILNGSPETKTIDGRRVYVIFLDKSQNNKSLYSIKNYKNIWTDHKRNDFEQLTIINSSGAYLPDAIHINFKGRLFKVEKN